jgi:uncharacterized cofD-like protein
MNQPRIVLIGGGTGSFTLLQGLKEWTPNISAIVNMSDDGGSSGELRDELGVLPPGDIRQCLVALSNSKQTRDLFSYRFANGKLDGHPVGNIILSALELQTGSFAQAVAIVSDFMQITGQVIPVSTNKHKLVMIDDNKTITGENNIGKHKITDRDAKLVLRPKAAINPKAAEAIQKADLVVIAPGNLYCSILPALCVRGMPEELNNTKAKVVMVANLINKPLHTNNWHVVDYLDKIEEYSGKQSIDYVLCNFKLPDASLLEKYSEEGEYPVRIEAKRLREVRTKIIGGDFLGSKIFHQDPNDRLTKRTLIRHDADKVVRHLKKIIS